MRASHRWLVELTGLPLDAAAMAARFTRVGLEVEAVVSRGRGLDGIVVAEVVDKAPHPTKSGLTLVTVTDGTEARVIVCGAPNVPDAGGRVVLAKLGARLPNGLEIAPRKVAGVDSPGMLCGETELDLGPDDAGLLLLGPDVGPLGAPIAEALSLVDDILELGVTPNRPDALGHRGLARELCAIEGVPFAPPARDAGLRFSERTAAIAVEVADAAGCPRYAAARLDGVTVGPSPFALRYRLHTLGVRPISNVVDVTNAILLEFGHPIHGFDAAALGGDTARLGVRRAASGETLVTLDAVERALTDDDLVITDGAAPVALAGIMGGASSGVRESTRSVVVECAYFDPRSVRRTARRQGLHTDASHRFERGVDPSAPADVLQATLVDLQALAGGTIVAEALDVGVRSPARARIRLARARLPKLLGRSYDDARVVQLLTALGVEVSVDADGFDCAAPTHRPDLTRDVDLVEEVARLDGYDHIPVALARVRPSVDGTPRAITFARALRDAAVASGLHEAISYGFLSPTDLEVARVSTDAVVLENPLTVDRSVMRTSLIPGLLAATVRSLRGGVDAVRLCELGASFHPVDGAVLPDERRTLALLVAGTSNRSLGVRRPLDVFDVKGHVEAVLSSVTGRVPEVRLPSDVDPTPPHLHPRRAAFVHLGGVRVGVLGEVHPDVTDALSVPCRVMVAELSVDALLAAADVLGVPRAVGLPRFPGMVRDVAWVTPEEVPAAALVATARAAGGSLLESVDVFDEYRGAGLPAGCRSLAFRLTYRDADATLTDERLEPVHQAVLAAARDAHGATPR